jgi:hypothetical protein
VKRTIEDVQETWDSMVDVFFEASVIVAHNILG